MRSLLTAQMFCGNLPLSASYGDPRDASRGQLRVDISLRNIIAACKREVRTSGPDEEGEHSGWLHSPRALPLMGRDKAILLLKRSMSDQEIRGKQEAPPRRGTVFTRETPIDSEL